MIALPIYAPILGYWFVTGTFAPTTTFPYGFADIYDQLGVLLLVRRLIAAVMAVLAVWLAWKIVFFLTGSTFASATSALLVLLNYWFLHYSKTGNVDVPMLLWLLAGTYCWLHALERPSTSWYVGTAVFVALAVSTKDVAAAFVLPMIALLGVVHVVRAWRSQSWSLSCLAWSALAGVVVYGLASLFFFYPHQVFSRLAMFSGSGWGVEGYYQGGWLAVLGRTVWITWTSMSLPAFLLGCVGGVWALARRAWLHASLLVPLVGYYVIDIGRIGFVFDRHVMPIAVVLALLAGLAVAYAQRNSVLRAACVIVVPVVLACALVVSTTVITQMNNDSRYAVEAYVSRLPSNASVVTFDVSTWQGRYGLFGRNVTFVHDTNTSLDYLRRERPDFIVVSENTIKSRLDYRGLGAAQNAIDALFDGSAGYRVAVVFGNATVAWAPPRDPDRAVVQRVDPTIYVFKRRMVP
jgi:4-amino-4-deoxy-L-arabinose transferase-like glycosyltransferase